MRVKRTNADRNSSDTEDGGPLSKVRRIDDPENIQEENAREDSSSNVNKRVFNKEYIKNNIDVLKFLGSGTYGLVNLVKDKTSGDNLAIKMGREGKICREEFLKEVDMMRRAQGSEHVIGLKGYCEVSQENSLSKFYIFMEYFEGLDLNMYVMKHPLKHSEIQNVLHKVGSALKHIHQAGIIHRDVKPSNIMISKDMQIKLIDFGLADVGPRISGQSGTISYMAPEMYDEKKNGEYGCEIDYYAVGVITYELLFRILPFEYLKPFLDEMKKNSPKMKQNQMEVHAKLNGMIKFPRALDRTTMEFLNGCLKTDPDQRLGDQTFLEHPFFHRQMPN